jgi:pyruvate/2-oxoglutarate dehydrogenase complex dihydrolipoamide dehydrogenase (E3) component
METYDLIVIGAGTAAQVVAGRVQRGSRTVAVIDHPPFGDSCALRGSDPMKMLVRGAVTLPSRGAPASRETARQNGTGTRRGGSANLCTVTRPRSMKTAAGYSARTSGAPTPAKLINLFGLAIRHDLTVGYPRDTMFAYPTGASDIGNLL